MIPTDAKIREGRVQQTQRSKKAYLNEGSSFFLFGCSLIFIPCSLARTINKHCRDQAQHPPSTLN